MAVSRVKTWIAEILTFANLNAEFDNILNNGEDLGWPATKAKDLDGQELILDSDADSSVTSDTDDRIDFRAGGQDIVRFDGTTASSLNFFDLASRATGVAPVFKSRGESNVGMVIQDSNGNEALILGSVASAVNELSLINAATGNTPIVRTTGENDIGIQFQNSDSEQMLTLASVATAVNELTIVNAATGNKPVIRTTGESDIGIEFQNSDSEQMLICASVATAVNEVTITNAATGDNPSVAATGETNVGLNLVSKGTGTVQANGVPLTWTYETLSTTTGGASIAFTGILAGITEIDVFLLGLSATGTDEILIQIGPSGGLVTSGYVSQTADVVNDNGNAATTGFYINVAGAAANTYIGEIHLRLVKSSTNLWTAESSINVVNSPQTHIAHGNLALSGNLSLLSVVTSGSDTFDINSGVQIRYR